MDMEREIFTTSEALALLLRSEDDNRLWKNAMRRIHRAIIRLDGISDAVLSDYRSTYQF